MSDYSTRNIIDFAYDDDGKAFRDALYAEIHDRVAGKFAERKVELAQTFLAPEHQMALQPHAEPEVATESVQIHEKVGESHHVHTEGGHHIGTVHHIMHDYGEGFQAVHHPMGPEHGINDMQHCSTKEEAIGCIHRMHHYHVGNIEADAENAKHRHEMAMKKLKALKK